MSVAFAEYAGVKLPLWTPNCDAALARANLDLSRFQQFATVPDDSVLNGLPLPPRLFAASIRGGSLWWPTGASQFARAHFVVDTATLTAIRSALTTAAGSSTAGYTAATLKLDDGLGGTAVETALHLLPPFPLVGSEDSYLLTLVDERFYWWFRPTVSLSSATTWSAIYSTLGTGIGSTVTVDGSLSAFAAPSSRWLTLGSAPLPLLLDAAAWCTGRRIIRQLDGTVKATNYATAKAAAATVRSSWGSTYRRRGGGVVIDSDARKSAPEFALVKCGSLSRTVSLNSLSISDYSGVTGKTGYLATVQTDAATLTSGEANALATEWYQWLLAGETTSLAGLPPIQPNGWYGAAEWVLRRDDCGLRLLPAPLDFGHSSGSDAAYVPTATDTRLLNTISVSSTVFTDVLSLTASRSGKFVCGFEATFLNAGATRTMVLTIAVNGTSTGAGLNQFPESLPSGAVLTFGHTRFLTLTAGDTVTLQAFTSTSGVTALGSADGWDTRMWLARVE